jgi:hypothetical protein
MDFEQLINQGKTELTEQFISGRANLDNNTFVKLGSFYGEQFKSGLENLIEKSTKVTNYDHSNSEENFYILHNPHTFVDLESEPRPFCDECEISNYTDLKIPVNLRFMIFLVLSCFLLSVC